MVLKDLLKDKLLKKFNVELGIGETTINNWGKIFKNFIHCFKFSLYFFLDFIL